MTTINPTPEEMNKRIVRAKTIQPKKKRFAAGGGIPSEAMESIAADSIYLYMAPETGVGATSQNPGVVGFPGLTVNVCRCPVGQGPDLHSHARTLETFMCLKGQFEIRWGDDGQYSTLLDEQDMISVPPNVMRAFRNTGLTPEAHLLVLIQGQAQDMAADINMPRKPESGWRGNLATTSARRSRRWAGASTPSWAAASGHEPRTIGMRGAPCSACPIRSVDPRPAAAGRAGHRHDAAHCAAIDEPGRYGCVHARSC